MYNFFAPLCNAKKGQARIKICPKICCSKVHCIMKEFRNWKAFAPSEKERCGSSVGGQFIGRPAQCGRGASSQKINFAIPQILGKIPSEIPSCNHPRWNSTFLGKFWCVPALFLKPFLKENILQSGEWDRDKFDFDHHFAFWPTNFLKTFCLVASFSACQTQRIESRSWFDHFQKCLFTLTCKAKDLNNFLFCQSCRRCVLAPNNLIAPPGPPLNVHEHFNLKP